MKVVMRTIDYVIAEARLLASGAPNPDPVGRARQAQAALITGSLAVGGFPVSDAEKVRLSHVPLIFQEANYDDIA